MRKYITKASERIGVESTSRDGKRAQVVSYSTCENFIIRFCDGKEMKLKNWRYFIEGNFNYEKHFKAPRNREERIGEKKVMNNGLTAEVIEYRGSHDMDILFEDGGKRTGVSWRDFCIGSIAHPTIPGGNVSQNELVLRFYLESLGFVRIPQRSKRSDRVGLESKQDELYKALQQKGYPDSLCREIAYKQMNTDYTATRMLGYLYRISDPRPEDVVDEMLAILSDRNAIIQKKELEHAQATINKVYREGL